VILLNKFGRIWLSFFREILIFFGKMRLIMDERASARFVAGTHR